MRTTDIDMTRAVTHRIECDHWREYNRSQAWTVALCVGVKHTSYRDFYSTAYPEAFAVVDDFGTLKTVTPWS
ncbi:MAG: hypothetical protein AAFW48_01560 [Pseudomonadota bacterium]